MSKKITLKDFGRLVKPKVLTEAFLLCGGGNIDIDKWWRRVNQLSRSSKTYKKVTIEGTFGEKIDPLFQSLQVNDYVAVINSFIVFHNFSYSHITTQTEVNRLLQEKRRVYVIAAGVTIHKTYNIETHALGEVWQPTNNQSICWIYNLGHLIPIEDVELYNSVETGDLLMFDKSQAVVTKVKTLKRRKFYDTCSWTNKKITVLNGSAGRQVRLITSRSYKIIKPPKN